MFVVVLILCCCSVCVHRGGQANMRIDQELKSLIEEERKLDELIQSCTRQVHQMFENRNSQRYPLIVISALFCAALCEKNY